MKIIMKVGIAGDGFSYAPGQEVEFSDDNARRLIESGQAVPVRKEEVEQAVRAAPEHTAKRGRKRK